MVSSLHSGKEEDVQLTIKPEPSRREPGAGLGRVSGPPGRSCRASWGLGVGGGCFLLEMSMSLLAGRLLEGSELGQAGSPDVTGL